MTDSEPRPYDVNFCFPVRELENDRVKLTPFIPALHANAYFEGSRLYPEFYDHVPIGPFTSAQDFVTQIIDTRTQPNPGIVIFAVIAKPSDALAGIIGLMNTSAENLCSEIGFVMTLPAYQRQRLTAHAIALLLSYSLCLTPHGLGLRRVQWRAGMENPASMRLAEKMGFRQEALLRWDAAFPVGKSGRDTREGEAEETRAKKGRDTVVMAVCWDDWEGGVRERVERMLRDEVV